MIHKLHSDSSSDEDQDPPGRRFIIPQLTPSAKALMQVWVKEAHRRMELKDCIQPMIERAKRTHCERCLGRKLLKVQTVLSVEEM